MVSLVQQLMKYEQFKLPGAGIYADTGIYADVTNVDFLYIVGTF